MSAVMFSGLQVASVSLIKPVAKKGSINPLGTHLLAPEGSDHIQTAAMVIKAEIPKRDDLSIFDDR